jgi:hypothetical protein
MSTAFEVEDDLGNLVPANKLDYRNRAMNRAQILLYGVNTIRRYLKTHRLKGLNWPAKTTSFIH